MPSCVTTSIDLILPVFLVSPPNDVVQPIVGWNVVKMTSDHALGARSDESFKDEMVHIANRAFAVDAHVNELVTVWMRVSVQNPRRRSKVMIATTSNPPRTNASEVADLVAFAPSDRKQAFAHFSNFSFSFS